MDASAKIYSGLILSIYDFWVLVISNAFAWKCSTRSVLIPFWNKPLASSSAHLDAGIGTGFYPSRPSSVANLRKLKHFALLDLNPATIEATSARIRGAGYTGEIAAVEHSVFLDLPEKLRGKFDTISLFYLFHCLPGAFPTKVDNVMSKLVQALVPSPESVVYGSTILGEGVTHNWFGRSLMRLYNRKGIFSNYQDSAEGLEEGLRHFFDKVDVTVVGKVALFTCKGLKSRT